MILNGMSMSEPHTSELNCNFLYIIYMPYVILYVLNAVI